MKSFLLFTFCAALTSPLIAQSSAYTPFQQSFSYSPNHTSDESSGLFNLMTDPYLAIQANPADARFFRTGKTIINATWQSEQREEYIDNRNWCPSCFQPHGGLLIYGPAYRSLPVMQPRLGIGWIQHFEGARLSPVLGVNLQHFEHETGFIDVPSLHERYSAHTNSIGSNAITLRDTQKRSGLLLNTHLSLTLSDLWSAGIRYQIGSFSSDGNEIQPNYQFGIRLTETTSALPVANRQSTVISDAGQHELSAGLYRQSEQSSISLSYTYFTGQEDIFLSGSVDQDQNRSLYDTEAKQVRHSVFSRYSRDLSSNTTFTWLGRAAFTNGARSGFNHSISHWESYTPESTYRIYYQSTSEYLNELDSDASQTAIETGFGLTNRHSKWKLNFGLFTGYSTMRSDGVIISSGRYDSEQIRTDPNGNPVRTEYSESYQGVQNYPYREHHRFFRVPILAEIHARENIRFMFGAEMGYRNAQHSESGVNTDLWIGTRVSPSDHWNLTLRTHNIQKNSFSRYALRDMQSVMVSVTYSR